MRQRILASIIPDLIFNVHIFNLHQPHGKGQIPVYILNLDSSAKTHRRDAESAEFFSSRTLRSLRLGGDTPFLQETQ